MTHEIIIGIIFFALPVITITAFFVAGTIIKMQERNDQRVLDAIAAKYAADIAADKEIHEAFMTKHQRCLYPHALGIGFYPQHLEQADRFEA